MSASQKTAIAVALESLGYDVRDEGAEVIAITQGYPADEDLELGDVVTEAQGKPISTPEDLYRAMQGTKPGEQVEITVDRERDDEGPAGGHRASRQQPGRAVMGIAVNQRSTTPWTSRSTRATWAAPPPGSRSRSTSSTSSAPTSTRAAGLRSPARSTWTARSSRSEASSRRRSEPAAVRSRRLPRTGQERGRGPQVGRRARDRARVDVRRGVVLPDDIVVVVVDNPRSLREFRPSRPFREGVPEQ